MKCTAAISFATAALLVALPSASGLKCSSSSADGEKPGWVTGGNVNERQCPADTPTAKFPSKWCYDEKAQSGTIKDKFDSGCEGRSPGQIDNGEYMGVCQYLMAMAVAKKLDGITATFSSTFCLEGGTDATTLSDGTVETITMDICCCQGDNCNVGFDTLKTTAKAANHYFQYSQLAAGAPGPSPGPEESLPGPGPSPGQAAAPSPPYVPEPGDCADNRIGCAPGLCAAKPGLTGLSGMAQCSDFVDGTSCLTGAILGGTPRDCGERTCNGTATPNAADPDMPVLPCSELTLDYHHAKDSCEGRNTSNSPLTGCSYFEKLESCCTWTPDTTVDAAGNSGVAGPSASPSAAPLIQQTVDYEVEGTLATMTETEQTTTKANARKAFIDASGTITDSDVDKVTLAQKPASGRRERRADTIVVTITLKSNIDKSTATAAAAKEVEFEVVANGKTTTVKKSGTAKEVTTRKAAAAPSALPQLATVVLGTLLVLA